MQALLPGRAQQPWPTLQVDQATAKRYMDMLHARKARDRIKTAEIAASCLAALLTRTLGSLGART